jgi:hypothetical protein
MPAVAAAAIVIRSLVLEPPLRELADRGLCAAYLAGRVPSRRRKGLEEPARLRIGLAVDRVAEPVGHDDDQPAAIDERELETQELRVALRLAEEREGRPEVARRVDDCHPDLEVVALGRRQQGVQALGLRLVDLGRERQEEPLDEEVVTRRIPVRPRGRRQGEESKGAGEHRHSPDQSV